MVKPPVGVIFDLDGTLLDTLDDITASLNHALACLDRPPLHRDQVRRMVGEGLPALIFKALGAEGGPDAETLITEYSRHHEQHFCDRTRPYPGIADLLDQISAANHPIAVLSNKPDRLTRKVVSELLARWRFIAAHGPTATRPRKPDPQGALEIARSMERAPERIFLVGDSLPDIETARAAGMTSIAVTWGFRDRTELAAAHPDYLVDTPAEVATVILNS